MARPRQFDERRALDAAVDCFWRQGYEATSIRDLATGMGVNVPSLYNAFGDKRALFLTALEHYAGSRMRGRLLRLESSFPPEQAIAAFFDEVIEHSLTDPQQRGCLIVNTALELAPADPDVARLIAGYFNEIERFFVRCLDRSRQTGPTAVAMTTDDLARHLLGVMLGLRVAARARPERHLLEAIARPALALVHSADADRRGIRRYSSRRSPKSKEQST